MARSSLIKLNCNIVRTTPIISEQAVSEPNFAHRPIGSTFGQYAFANVSLTMSTRDPRCSSAGVKSRPRMIGAPTVAKKPEVTAELYGPPFANLGSFTPGTRKLL